MEQDKHKRSIVKALSWRMWATIATIIIVFFFTGELTLAVEIGAVEVVSKLMLYYLHERIWSKIGWGSIQAENTTTN